jgi:AcrR family transcriptional regulator
MIGRSVRTVRAGTTREAILAAAERLFAEQGVAAVSNRQISEAAGQGNNTAVGYHFGSKTDLIRAVIRLHTTGMDEIRQRLLAGCADSTELRDWIVCTVRPVTDHLAALGTPSWYARFTAQLMTDPRLRAVLLDDAHDAPTIKACVDGVNRLLTDLPPRVRAERNDMIRALVVHTCAERERTLAEGATPLRPTWETTANDLVDAIHGLLLAPVTRP